MLAGAAFTHINLAPAAAPITTVRTEGAVAILAPLAHLAIIAERFVADVAPRAHLAVHTEGLLADLAPRTHLAIDAEGHFADVAGSCTRRNRRRHTRCSVPHARTWS